MQIPRIESVSQLFALARALEQEAARRYHELSARMAEGGHVELQQLFDRLAEEEERHGREVCAWAGRKGMPLGEPVLVTAWEVPLPGVEYDAEARDVHRSTPYKALALAVHNEQRAQALYLQIASETEDAEIARYARSMAREELGHATLLRHQRRRAFHAARRESGDEGLTALPDGLASVAELHARAADLESAVFACLGRASLGPAAEALALTGALLRRLGVAQLESHEPGADGNQAYSEALAACERAFAFYDLIATRSGDAEVAQAARELAEAALDRMMLFYA